MILCFWDKNTRKLRNFKSLKNKFYKFQLSYVLETRPAQETYLIAWHLSSDYNRFANQDIYFQSQLDITLTPFSFHKRVVEFYLNSVLKILGHLCFNFAQIFL